MDKIKNPLTQQLNAANQKLRKKIDTLLEAYEKALTKPELTLDDITALTSELEKTLEPLYEDLDRGLEMLVKAMVEYEQAASGGTNP